MPDSKEALTQYIDYEQTSPQILWIQKANQTIDKICWATLSTGGSWNSQSTEGAFPSWSYFELCPVGGESSFHIRTAVRGFWTLGEPHLAAEDQAPAVG